MNINKSTRYGLHVALELASADGRSVSVAQVTERYRIPRSVLARPASRITVLDVIRALQSVGEERACSLSDATPLECPGDNPRPLRRLFDEVDEQTRATFASVTHDTLAR